MKGQQMTKDVKIYAKTIEQEATAQIDKLCNHPVMAHFLIDFDKREMNKVQKIRSCPSCNIQPTLKQYSSQSPFEAVVSIDCPQCKRSLSYSAWCITQDDYAELGAAAIQSWNEGETGVWRYEKTPKQQKRELVKKL